MTDITRLSRRNALIGAASSLLLAGMTAAADAKDKPQKPTPHDLIVGTTSKGQQILNPQYYVFNDMPGDLQSIPDYFVYTRIVAETLTDIDPVKVAGGQISLRLPIAPVPAFLDPNDCAYYPVDVDVLRKSRHRDAARALKDLNAKIAELKKAPDMVYKLNSIDDMPPTKCKPGGNESALDFRFG